MISDFDVRTSHLTSVPGWGDLGRVSVKRAGTWSHTPRPLPLNLPSSSPLQNPQRLAKAVTSTVGAQWLSFFQVFMLKCHSARVWRPVLCEGFPKHHLLSFCSTSNHPVLLFLGVPETLNKTLSLLASGMYRYLKSQKSDSFFFLPKQGFRTNILL